MERSFDVIFRFHNKEKGRGRYKKVNVETGVKNLDLDEICFRDEIIETIIGVALKKVEGLNVLGANGYVICGGSIAVCENKTFCSFERDTVEKLLNTSEIYQ